ncbi:MAG: tRNA pseudouridine(55) synthase TruB [Nitrospira sp.]|nr:tRNA pseudouridine(55) synthase TruB [Nitrospira sp.]MCP9465441.1 tRNA pseudouridine(55) synthase TruB [Nitrospira sp.]
MSTSVHSGQHTVSWDGVLVVNKEVGWTSHDVVAKIRRLLGGVKVGHAGTLDPGATGVLPILVGRATRIAEFLIDWDKEYRAVLRLGETTDTQDATGRVVTRVDASGISRQAIDDVIARFRGPQRQLPPMYSAVKVGGQPLYKAARAGKTVAREERSIVIHVLDVLAIDGPDVTLHVVCSKGTYVRTLCADIGRMLGVGGHLLTLERQRVGPLSLAQAMTIRQVAELVQNGTLHEQLLPLRRVLEGLPSVVVTDEEARLVVHGGAVCPTGSRLPMGAAPSVALRLEDKEGRLLGIGVRDARVPGMIRAHKVLAELERGS